MSDYVADGAHPIDTWVDVYGVIEWPHDDAEVRAAIAAEKDAHMALVLATTCSQPGCVGHHVGHTLSQEMAAIVIASLYVQADRDGAGAALTAAVDQKRMLLTDETRR